MLAPEMTPERTVINFLKEVGKGNYESAGEWVGVESRDQIESWARLFFFPDRETPPTAENEANIDQFIGLFYRVTLMEESEDSAKIHLVFVATDALVGFPSVADNPLVPNSVSYTVILRKDINGGNGTDRETESGWEIISLEPGMQ